jgi:uncharacterized protein (DUF58 family)
VPRAEVADGPRIGVPELTGRGWTLIGGAGGLVVAGKLFGSDALTATGLAAGFALLLALAWVARRRDFLPLSRELHPARLSVGGEGRVVLSGTTTAATPWLTITEAVDEGRRAARFALVPLGPGVPVRAGYRVLTDRRGRRAVGPALLTLSDPCGLVRRTWVAAGVGEILVRPRVHEIVPPARGGGGEPTEGASGPRVPVAEALGEFLGLREYEPGDDPRRVHWRSSARRGQLLVRVDDAPAPGRAVVLLDTRPAVHDESSFEDALEVAASVATVLHRTHQAPEVVTSGGETMRRGGVSALDAVLDRLAVLEPEPVDHLAAVTGVLRHRLGLGAVVVVTGTADQTIVDAAAALQGRRIVTMVVTRPLTLPTGAIRLVDTSTEPFADAWNAAVQVSSRWHLENFKSRSRSPR